MNYSKILIFLIIGLLLGCKKNDHPNIPQNKGVDIFIAGNKNEISDPFVMKNGVITNIEINGLQTASLRLMDFKVTNGKTYGLFHFDQTIANSTGAYMVNETVKPISLPYSEGLKALQIQNNDVYIAGNFSQNNIPQSYILKNGQLSKTYDHFGVENYTRHKNINYTSLRDSAEYYIENEKVSLPSIGNVSIADISIFENNHYITGTYEYYDPQGSPNTGSIRGVYWINGELHHLPNTPLLQRAYKIFKDENNLYIFYSEYEPGAIFSTFIKYLKNGVMYPVPYNDFGAYPMDMIIHNGDVYILLTTHDSVAGLVAHVFRNNVLLQKYPLPDVYIFARLKLGISNKKL